MSGITIIYAGFWKRLLAYIIDILIMIVPIFIIGFIVSYFAISSAKTELEMEVFSAGAEGLTRIMSLIVTWIYYATMESSSKQGTLGKMVLGIKVTDYNGGKISFRKASGRFFGKILSGLLLGIGFLMIGFTNKKQGLHDIMAGTLTQLKNQWNEKYHNENRINKGSGYQKLIKTIPTTIKPIKNYSSHSKDTSMKQMRVSSISKNEKVEKKIQENENKLYKQIWKEIEENKTDIDLWAKCFSSCDGDSQRTKANYIRLRVKELKIKKEDSLIQSIYIKKQFVKNSDSNSHIGMIAFMVTCGWSSQDMLKYFKRNNITCKLKGGWNTELIGKIIRDFKLDVF